MYRPFSLRPCAVILAAAPLWLLTGCSRTERSPGKQQAAKPATVRFAYQDRVVDAVPIVAVAKGYFRDEGLTVETSRFTNGPACSEALLSDAADIGTMGDATAVIAAVRHAPVKILASHGNGEHRHRLMVRKDSRLRRPGDLVGKKLAVKKGTSTYGGLLLWAKKHDLDLAKVDVIDLRPGDMAEALRSGSIDAAVASEPTPSQIEAKGIGRELATLGGLGNSYPVMLVVRERFLEMQPEAVSGFLRAMRRAAKFLTDSPDEACRLVAKATGLSVEVATAAMSRHEYALRLDEAIRKSLQQTAQFLLSQKTIEHLPDWTRVLDTRWIRKASSEGMAQDRPDKEDPS